MSQFLRENWGSLVSVLGLALTVWTLAVARGARKAAEDARSVARGRNLVETLEEANSKIKQVGIFLRQRKWEVTQLRVEEVLGSCNAALARWDDPSFATAKNNLRTICTQLRSLAALSSNWSATPPTEEEHKRALRVQLRSSELISGVLGQARRTEERSG